MSMIDVLIPVYNSENFIAETIKSLQQQTYQDFRILIVDDGSTDKSEEIVKSFSDSRIKYFKNEKNLGIANTRNRLLSLAEAPYVAWLDSDDIAKPNRLNDQLLTFKDDENLGLCGSFIDFVDEKGNFLSTHKLPSEPSELRVKLFFRNMFVTSSVMVKTRILKTKKFEIEYDGVEDYPVWSEIARDYKVRNIEKSLVKYRIRNENITNIDGGPFKFKSKLARILKSHSEWLGLKNQSENLEHLALFLAYEATLKEGIEKSLLWVLDCYKANRNQRLYDPLMFKYEAQQIVRLTILKGNLPIHEKIKKLKKTGVWNSGLLKLKDKIRLIISR